MPLFSYLRKNTLFLTSLFLLAFIPLYPKIPLFDILPGYIVRVRVEDLLILLASGVWFWHALKNRAEWRNGYLGFVGLYAIGGLFSIILGVFLLQTIPLELLHIGKSALHYFRYLEYFALFFIVFSGIQTKEHARKAVFVLAAATSLVIIYGIGQKFMHFPLYSTMNREYSKGQAFYLEAGGKVSSTFGGHYDLAGFLVIVLPLIFSFSLGLFSRNKKRLLIFAWLQVTHLAGVWLLIETASKTALIAYLLAMAIVVLLHIRRINSKKVRVFTTTASLASVVLVAAVFLTLFGASTKVRFSNLFYSILQSQENADPTDLVGSGYEWKVFSTTSLDGEVITERKLEKSTWSPNAVRYGISMGIRLDTLWPQALRGLSNNPLFGSGYGTLSKLENSQFVEADSTDNNYLRTLGETGLIGFAIFYGFVLISMRTVTRQLKDQSGMIAAISIGYLGASVGLLLNALYIDVFAASKVAFIFWGISGLTLRMSAKLQGRDSLRSLLLHLSKHKVLYVSLVLSFFILHQNPFAAHSQLLAFESSPKSLENFVAARCFVERGSFDLCRTATGIVTDHGFSAYSVLLVPFVWLSDNPAVYYYLNFGLFLLALFVLYAKLKVRNFLLLFLFVILAYERTATSHPLEDSDLLRLFVMAPLAIFFFQYLIKQKKRKKLFLGFIIAPLVLIPLIRPALGAQFLENFRNDRQVVKRDVVLQANANLEASNYLLTALSPYYVDLFSNQKYEVLSAAQTQTYIVYQKLLEQGSKLFLSDYGLDSDQGFFHAFADLRKNFDVRYKTIDCYDECSLYTVEQLSQKISPLPISIGLKQLEPNTLSDSYTFAVVSNRYEKDTTQTFADYLQSLKPLTEEKLDFLVLTGDISPSGDTGSIPTINNLFTDLAPYPILYNPGNYDLLPQKPYEIGSERFYTDRDYFILLNIGADSVATNAQRLFVFNALLELEQLPDIKNLFIISHDLNWQDDSNPKNFIHQLRDKRAEFPAVQTYIISANHGDETQQSEKLENNIFYKATSENIIFMVFSNPSANPTFGSQPSNSRALEISGFLRVGSSPGKS